MVPLIINVLAVVIGSGLGLLVKRKINAKISDAVLAGIGACAIYIGITGFSESAGTIVTLLSFAIGALIGTALDIDGRTNRFGEYLEHKFSKGNGGNGLTGGCITFFLVSCGGAYTIMASFNAGIGDNTMLYTKATMDFIVSMTMSAAMGIGVMFASVLIFVYQGALILLTGLLSPLLTEAMADALSNVGALITLIIGLNMVGATKIKTLDFVPAIIAAPVIAYMADLLPAIL